MSDRAVHPRFPIPRVIIMAAAVGAGIPACFSGAADRAAQRHTVEVGRARWAAAGLRNYRFEIHLVSVELEAPWVEVTVRDSQVGEVVPLPDDGAQLPPALVAPQAWPTLPQLLDLADSALTKRSNVDLELDETMGFPRLMVIRPGAFTEEVDHGFAVRNVRPWPPQ